MNKPMFLLVLKKFIRFTLLSSRENSPIMAKYRHLDGDISPLALASIPFPILS
jgi:hypothetical protein